MADVEPAATTTDTTEPDAATAAVPTAHETAVAAWKKCYNNNGHDANATKKCAELKVKAFDHHEVEYWTLKVKEDCVTNKITLAADATAEDKVKAKAQEAACDASKLGLDAAKSGDMPWIIVGSVVGLVCIVGAVCCYQKNKADEDA